MDALETFPVRAMLERMSTPLPRLRMMDLDLMPSPVEDRPGLLMRDRYQYSDSTLIIPPVLVQCLEFFDGERFEADAKEHLYRLTGQIDTNDSVKHLHDALSRAGFLENDIYEKMRDDAHQQFAAAPARLAVHAGSAYPDEPGELKQLFDEYMRQDAGNAEFHDQKLIAIAAPHVSPFGGWESYQAAYRTASQVPRDRTFVILGTSHFGEPDCFGLTRKPFQTPYGITQARVDLVDELERKAPKAVAMEDYCHSFEHSIEFQVAFLQHIHGPDIKILPILCGSYARSIYQGGAPEENEDVNRFLEALGELQARDGKDLTWVLGIDMAHMGRRYGDPIEAVATRGEMVDVERRDRDRIDRVLSSDAKGFWERIQENHDDLKWCGSSPLYTFLKAVPGAKGHLLRYQQWNIDEESVVSFAGMAFTS